ncbi:ABC transporter permease [Streptomyces hokutonensis]|uniref:ABC transporter permease n=1 Tax=Streptomyces hokutonensis TaxID=1306990 RepID=UPI00382168A9
MVDAQALAPAWLRALVMLLGLLVGGVFLAMQTGLGTSLWTVVSSSTFGSSLGVSQVIQLATPLVLAGCAVAVAARAGMWNIGVEGQLVMGAWLATAVAYAAPGLPGVLLSALMIVAGFLGGAMWAAVPALARAYLGVSEAVTTLMLNFVAALWLQYWATGPWAPTRTLAVGQVSSRPITSEVWYPQFSLGPMTIGLGFPLALLIILLFWAAFRYTAIGPVTALVGTDERTARYAGTNAARVRWAVFVLSGGVGGLTGVIVELDQVHSFSAQLSDNTGYIAIAVAVIAAGSLAFSAPVAIVLAFVAAAGVSLQIAGVSSEVTLMLTGLLLLLAACSDSIARYRFRRTVPGKEEEAL